MRRTYNFAHTFGLAHIVAFFFLLPMCIVSGALWLLWFPILAGVGGVLIVRQQRELIRRTYPIAILHLMWWETPLVSP